MTTLDTWTDEDSLTTTDRRGVVRTVALFVLSALAAVIVLAGIACGIMIVVTLFAALAGVVPWYSPLTWLAAETALGLLGTPVAALLRVVRGRR